MYQHTPPRIHYLRVENYRALKSVELKEISPVTVLLGPNGSGKVLTIRTPLQCCGSLRCVFTGGMHNDH